MERYNRKDILAVAEHIGIAKTKAKQIMEQVEVTLVAELGDISQYRLKRRNK